MCLVLLRNMFLFSCYLCITALHQHVGRQHNLWPTTTSSVSKQPNTWESDVCPFPPMNPTLSSDRMRIEVTMVRVHGSALVLNCVSVCVCLCVCVRGSVCVCVSPQGLAGSF